MEYAEKGRKTLVNISILRVKVFLLESFFTSVLEALPITATGNRTGCMIG